MTRACRLERIEVIGTAIVAGSVMFELISWDSRIVGWTIRFGEYVFITLAAGGVQKTWDYR